MCILWIYPEIEATEPDDDINIRWHWHAPENFVLYFMIEVIFSCTITYMVEVKRKKFAEPAFFLDNLDSSHVMSLNSLQWSFIQDVQYSRLQMIDLAM